MLSKLIAAQNRRPWHPYNFLLFCGFVGVMRGVLEIVLQRTVPQNFEVFNYVPFYILLGLLLSFALSIIAGVSFQTVQKSLTVGLFIGLFPPLFDFLIFQNRSAFYAYYYLWDLKNIPYAWYKPQASFPAGETLAIWLSVAFCGAYVCSISRNIWRGFGGLIVGYLVFLIMGAILPMVLAKISGLALSTAEGARRANPQTLRLFASQLALFQALLAIPVFLMMRRELLKRVFRRALHIAPFVMLTVLGGTFVRANAIDLVQSALMTVAVFVVILVQNDYFDALEAQGKEPSRVEKYDLQFMNAFFAIALVIFLNSTNRGALAILVFFICGLLYNYPFYRARNYFPANLKIEGLWGLSAFLAGALIEPNSLFTSGGLLLVFLIFGGWSTVAVLKDLKDVEADQRSNVQTIFTIFTRHGHSVAKIWQIVRLGVLFLIFIPVWISIAILPLMPILVLTALTTLMAGTFWLTNYKRAFQMQLGFISVLIVFWQIAFLMGWLSRQ